MADNLLAALFALWLLLSVIRQFRGPWSRAISQCDMIRWVPHWGLFAVPTRLDLTVVSRFRRGDGSYSNWEAALPAAPEAWWRCLWHPHQITVLFMIAFVNDSAKVRDLAGRTRLCRSARYEALKRFVIGRVSDPDAVALQFMVLAHRAHEPARPQSPVFLSDFHDVIDAR